MAQQTINVGTSPNDGTGTPLRTAFQYTNSNFSELYTAVGPSGNNIVVPGSATISGDLTVDTSTLKVDSANNRVGIGTASPAFPVDIDSTVGTVLNINSTNANGSGIRILQSGVVNGYIGSAKYTVGGALADFSIDASGANSLIFGTNDVQRYKIDATGVSTWSISGSTAMTLNSTGLGIGVASPSAKLHIDGNLKINGATSEIFMATGAERTISASGSAGATALTFKRWDGVSAYVSDVIFSGTGNVGVGVTPTNIAGVTRFEIKGAGNSQVVIRTASTNASARDWMVASNFNAFGDFVIRQANSQGADPNSGTDRLVIDASGRPIFYSGVTTPATLSTNGQLTMTATSDTNLRFSYRGSDGVTRVANLTLA